MNVTSRNQNPQKWEIEMEADLSAAAAVTATRGENVTCTKTGTGTYSFVIKGTSALKMYAVLGRDSKLHGTPAGALTARITSVTQATDGTDDITVTVKTQALQVTAVNTDAVAIDRDTTGAAVLSVNLELQVGRMSSPF